MNMRLWQETLVYNTVTEYYSGNVEPIRQGRAHGALADPE